MPFTIIRDDITLVAADAIVNTANPLPTYGRGTDEAIYRAAGMEKLLAEREKIGVIAPGHAAVTGGYDLKARYIIHTVGPVWHGGDDNEEELLRSCLKESLRLATGLGCSSIAFPLISTGTYGFPKELALRIFTDTIYQFLMDNEMLVTLVVYDQEAYSLSGRIFTHVPDYLKTMKAPSAGIEKVLAETETSFHEYLLQLIIESGMQNPRIYNGANITRQHFSKIISSPDYRPSKNTICALAISLNLDIQTAENLLEKAGFVLSRSSRFDQVVRYFLENEMYNIIDDNIILFENGLDLLGAAA